MNFPINAKDLGNYLLTLKPDTLVMVSIDKSAGLPINQINEGIVWLNHNWVMLSNFEQFRYLRDDKEIDNIEIEPDECFFCQHGENKNYCEICNQ